MPIKLPDLDDRSYADLVAEAMASIPSVYPAWTDHNASNPGVALAELLAWLTEMVLYRTNQVPEKSYDAFLKLLNGPTWKRKAGQDLEDAIHETMVALRDRYRAVSADDYEFLTRVRWPGSPEAIKVASSLTINRVHCLPERDLEATNKLAAAPGHISLILVPQGSDATQPWIQPSAALRSGVKDFFKDRKLLTTRLHVVGPTYLSIKVTATIYLKEDADEDALPASAKDALFRCFHPWATGPSQPGWRLGGDVHLADVFTALEDVSGVDFVDQVAIAASNSTQHNARKIVEAGQVVGLRLDPHELPQLATTTLTMKERRGTEWVSIDA